MKNNCYLLTIVIFLSLCCKAKKSLTENDFLEGQIYDIEIVISANSNRSTRIAADELQLYLNKMTGMEIPIKSNNLKADYRIYVGQSKYTEGFNKQIPEEGFIIQSDEKALWLLGNDIDFNPPTLYRPGREGVKISESIWRDATKEYWKYPYENLFKNYNKSLDLWSFDKRGSLNAVYYYLESLGCRWYMPGEIGEHIPKLTSLNKPDINIKKIPDFPFRKMGFYSKAYFQCSKDELLWQLKLGLSSASELVGHMALGHGMTHVYDSEHHREEHQDYFSLLDDGSRDTRSRSIGKVCFSSEGLKAENIAYARSVFDKFNEPAISIMPGDALSQLCRCNLCTGLDSPERGPQGHLSDYVWNYVNEVASALYLSHPDKKVLCFAYGPYLLPPKQINKLSPNIMIGICQNRSTFSDENKFQEYKTLREQWLQKVKSKKLLIWDYYLHARTGRKFENIPALFTKTIQKDLLDLKGISFGNYIEVFRDHKTLNYNSDLAINHLNIYSSAKLMWDVDLSLDSLLEDYYDTFYGPAAQNMKIFFEMAELNWNKLTDDAKKILELFEVLDAAKASVKKGSNFEDRIALVQQRIEPLKLMTKRSTKRDLTSKLRFIHGNENLTLNGNLDKPIWKNHFAFPIRSKNKQEKNNTTVKVFHTPDGIHLGIFCQESNVAGMITAGSRNDDLAIADGEHIELLLETQYHSYYRFLINPEGKLIDANGSDQANIKWRSNLQYKTFVGKDFWSVEMTIPVKLKNFSRVVPPIEGNQPTEVNPWHFNLKRSRVNKSGSSKYYFKEVNESDFYNVDTFIRFYKRS